MIKLYSPENDSELAVIRSIFDGDGIRYFVHNDHFGTLKVGPRIDLLNVKTIMVSEDDFDRAKELLDDFIEHTQDTDENTKPPYTIADKFRMVIEAIVFGWFVPGNRWRNKGEDNKTIRD